MSRHVTVERTTSETDIHLSLNLDGNGVADIDTGLGFLDHMLTSLTRHSGINLQLRCKGDLQIDDHHTAEDCAIVLGQALEEALEERKGIARFGYAYAPLDEALARVVLDLSGRPFAAVNLELRRPMIGYWACENITHFFQSFAMSSRSTLHVDVLRGENDHHKAEAAFKALALALKQAIALTGDDSTLSTKGVLG